MGFFDHHSHAASRGLKAVYLSLEGVNSLEEALERVRENLSLGEKLSPLIFLDYDDSAWERGPTKEDLDKLSREIPIILRRVCGHKAVANSKALELLPNPPADGVLLEDDALHLFSLFPPGDEVMLEAARAAQEELLSLGITGIREIGSVRAFKAWRALEERGELKVEVEFYFYHEHLKSLKALGITTGFGGRVKVGGVKAFLDGSIGARTAAFSEPYADTGQKGLLLWDTGHLRQLAEEAQASGLRLMLHAIGDEAIAQALGVYREVLRKGNPLGHTVEHAEAITPQMLKQAKALGVVISFQPNFLQWQAPGGLYEQALGAERAKRLNPIGSALQEGCRVVLGSDSMPPGPLYGLKLLENHPNPSERVKMEEALPLYMSLG